MNTPGDGGPAFPQHGWTKDPEVLERMKQCSGLTLRDYFASGALNGMMVCSPGCDTPLGMAQSAYVYADAMLEARKK